MMEEHQLGGKLLAGVSRSFYLTLKALPEGLREPLSVAYLMARAADTIADTAGVPESLKKESLEHYNQLVQCADADVQGEVRLRERLIKEFVPLQTDKDEAQLLWRLDELFVAYRDAPSPQWEAMRAVLEPIVRGQLLDIERFPVDGQVRALNTATELDQYTWLVAGCVGEFWTKLCVQVLGNDFALGATTEQMIEWGIRFGKGLQLVNILRDIQKDLRLGRCYFPMEELAAHGLDLRRVQEDPTLLRAVTPQWEKLCAEYLASGVDYVEALNNRRLKYATALPLMLGVRTLAHMEKAPWSSRLEGIKVTRAEVGKILLDAGVAVLRKGGVRKWAGR